METGAYLVEEVLHQVGDADVVQVPVSQQELLQVLEFGDGVVAVPDGLAALFTLYTWGDGGTHDSATTCCMCAWSLISG